MTTETIPCPFLRALVHEEVITHQRVPIGQLARTIAKAQGARRLDALKTKTAVSVVALFAHGAKPRTLLRTLRRGVDLETLGNGPFDKHGRGSRIINLDGTINTDELDRLMTFADNSDPTCPRFTDASMQRFVYANLERSKGSTKWSDKFLMKGEWPFLVAIATEQSKPFHIRTQEVHNLMVHQALPPKVKERLSS